MDGLVLQNPQKSCRHCTDVSVIDFANRRAFRLSGKAGIEPANMKSIGPAKVRFEMTSARIDICSLRAPRQNGLQVSQVFTCRELDPAVGKFRDREAQLLFLACSTNHHCETTVNQVGSLPGNSQTIT